MKNAIRHRMLNAIRVVAAVLLFAQSAACVTATSTVVAERADWKFGIDPAIAPWDPGTGGSRGLTYFLPARLVTLEVVTSAKDLKKLEGDLEKAKKAETTAKETKEKAEGAQKEQKQKVDRLKANAGDKPTAADTAAIAAAEKALADAAAETGLAADAATKAGEGVKNIEGLIAIVKADPNGCLYAVTVKTASIVADQRRLFRLNPSHSWLRDDKGVFKVTSGGLLSSTNVTATDRTGDILVEAAGASAAKGLQIESIHRPAKSGLTCATTPPFTMTFDPLGANATTSSGLVNTSLRDRDLPFGVTLTPMIDIEVDKLLPGATERPGAFDQKGQIPGVAYRVEVPAILGIYQTQETVPGCTAAWCLVNASIVSLPQVGPVGFIPMRSSAFVERVNDVEFENGMLKTWTYNRPSEAWEIVRIPVRVAKAAISVLTDLVTLKLDLSTKEASQVEKDRLALEYQLKKDRLEACVALSGTDVDAAAACIK